jgi:hypothetical protein
MAANWAVKEVFCGIGYANGCIEVATDDRCGVCWTFSHDFV